MQDGSFQRGQGISLATNSFTYEECNYLACILTNKYNLKTSVVKTGVPNQWRISIWKESMPILINIVSPYFIPEMEYKLYGRPILAQRLRSSKLPSSEGSLAELKLS